MPSSVGYMYAPYICARLPLYLRISSLDPAAPKPLISTPLSSPAWQQKPRYSLAARSLSPANNPQNLLTLSHQIAALKRTQSSHRTALKIRFQTDFNKLTSELRQLKTFHEKHAPRLEDLEEIRAYVSQAEREKERKEDNERRAKEKRRARRDDISFYMCLAVLVILSG